MMLYAEGRQRTGRPPPGNRIAMQRFKRHFFVCGNHRPIAGKPSCGARNSAEICAALQRAVAGHPALCGSVAVTACDCLGPCFDGPNMVVYPEGIWYAGVTVDDVPELVASHMLAGEPVSRLVYEWPDDD